MATSRNAPRVNRRPITTCRQGNSNTNHGRAHRCLIWAGNRTGNAQPRESLSATLLAASLYCRGFVVVTAMKAAPAMVTAPATGSSGLSTRARGPKGG